MTVAGPSHETVLRDIDSALQWRKRERLMPWEERAADCAEIRAAKSAVAAFAAINGWRKAPAFFDLSRLGRGAPTRSHHWADHCRDRRLLDHPIWFYAARRYVAAVGQPYLDVADLREWRANLAERGFVLHVPPDPLASIHFPGSTLFVVVTKAGGAVKWLPEQDGRLKALWRARRKAEAAQSAQALAKASP